MPYTNGSINILRLEAGKQANAKGTNKPKHRNVEVQLWRAEIEYYDRDGSIGSHLGGVMRENKV